MSNRPHKPPEFGGGPSKPKRGRPRKAPRNVEKPVKPREPWLSKPLSEPRIYPVWTRKDGDKWQNDKPQRDYWETFENLIGLSRSQVNSHEADLARVKVEQHLVKRPDEYTIFPNHILDNYPELVTHHTRPTLADLRNKIKRTKKERTYLKELPKNEDSESHRLRVDLIYYTWIAGQVNGWLNARQLMHRMDMENYNTFRGQLHYLFTGYPVPDPEYYSPPYYGYETKQIRMKGRKATLYRLKTVPANRWLPAPRHVAPLISIRDENVVPENYERPVKFILETNGEGHPVKPLRMVDLLETPDTPMDMLVKTRTITEGVSLWDTGYPGVRKGV